MSEPTLKCVIAWSNRRNLCSIIGDQLAAIVAEEDTKRLGEDTYAVSTDLDPAAIRDHLTAQVGSDEGLLVIEFEKWSSHGTAVDSTWLLRRGH